MNNIRKGATVLFSEGEYSDFGVETIGLALKDIATEEVLEAYLEAHPEQREAYQFKRNQFITWLIAQKFIEEIRYTDWFLGTYSNYRDMDVTLPEERGNYS